MHDGVVSQAEGLIGSPMTYSLFEVAKEKAEEMTVDLPEHLSEPVTTVCQHCSGLSDTVQ